MPRVKTKEKVTLTTNDIVRSTAFSLNTTEGAIVECFKYLSELQKKGVKYTDFTKYLANTYRLTDAQANTILKNWQNII